MAKRIGKCTNYSGCKLAYRNEQINVVTKEFRCPECGSPLEPVGPKKDTSLTTVLILSVAVVLLLAIGAIVWTLMHPPTRSGGIVTITPSPTQTPIPTPTLTPTPTPPPPPTEPPTPAPPITPAPTPESSATPINLDVTGESLEQALNAIMKRIELQPTLSRAEKDRIREEVQGAKKMGRIAVIQFNANASAIPPQDVASIVSQFDQPQVKKLLEDPRIQLAILGYADRQGDDQKNFVLSNDRAQTVLRVLIEKCHVLNTMYAVPMGGTDLFDSRAFARNRTVEVWAGQP